MRVSRTIVWNLFKYVLAFGLLGYVIWVNWKPESDSGLASVWQRHVVEGQPVQYGYLGLAFLLICLSSLLTLVRWYFLVRAQGLPFHIRDAFRLGLIGFFFNTFLPGSVGGDVVKAAGIARGQKRRTVAVATVIMDRAIAVWAMIMLVAFLGGVFWYSGVINDDSSAGAKTIVTFAAYFVGVSVMVWLLLGFMSQRRAEIFAGRLNKIPKVGHSTAEFWRAVWMYRCRQKSVYLALALTWIGQVGFVFGFFFSAMTLYSPAAGDIPTAAEHFLLVPIGLIIQAVPLFPGGTGIGEAGFGGLYQWFECTAAVAVLGSLVMRILTWIFALGGFAVAQRMGRAPAPTVEVEPPTAPNHTLQPACESVV